jgi:hypothetical protein
MKPNLFHYATSELSQDAILCWLLSWADNKHKADDPILHELGRNFLNSICECTHEKYPGNYQSIEIRQQDGGIDILCLVNGDIALIIEDKVGSKQHSDQLARYKQHVIKMGFSSDKIISVYLQSRDQSDYSEVLKHGYSVYERRDILKVLESSSGRAAQDKSDVVASYTSYLRQIEDEVQSFNTLPPKDWSGESWKGFYTELQKTLEDARWDYVANPSGGFLGFWWHFLGDDQCEQYLQIEQDKFCFKIWVKDQEKRRELREHWHQRILEVCSRHGLKAKRPDRFGNGNYMTVAILDQDFRIVNERNQIDLPRTLELLKKAESVLDDAKAQPAGEADGGY